MLEFFEGSDTLTVPANSVNSKKILKPIDDNRVITGFEFEPNGYDTDIGLSLRTPSAEEVDINVKRGTSNVALLLGGGEWNLVPKQCAIKVYVDDNSGTGHDVSLIWAGVRILNG